MAQKWYGAGELWKREVETRGARPETRKEFYGDKALRKVGEKLLGADVTKDLTPDEIVAKLKEREDITKNEKILEKKWGPDKVRPGRYISHMLADFFEKECGSSRATADALIALKYLNAELENVDWVQGGETIEIENGILTVKSGGEIVARGAILPREKLPADSPEAISRRGTIKKRSRAARTKMRTEVERRVAPPAPPLMPEPAAVAPPLPPPEPAEVAPPSPPIASAGAVIIPPPLPATPHRAAVPPLAPEPAARPEVIAPPPPAAPDIELSPTPPAEPRSVSPMPPPPEAHESSAEREAKEFTETIRSLNKLKISGHEIVKTKDEAAGIEYEIRLKGKPNTIAKLKVEKSNPKAVATFVLKPAFESPAPDEERIGTFDNMTELKRKLTQALKPVVPEKLKARRTEVLAALKADKKLKDFAHEIHLDSTKGPVADLEYAKIVLRGKTGQPLDVGYVGIFKRNPTYLVLENLKHERINVWTGVTALANEAAEKLTWANLETVPGETPPAPEEPEHATAAPERREAVEIDPHFNLSRAEFRRLQSYTGAFRPEQFNDVQMSRTFRGRLNDHITLLHDIQEHILGNRAAVFIDIGPGLGNPDAPGITSCEMAQAFPDMHVVALDLAEQVKMFETQVSPRKREAVRANRNLSIVAGDGLKSLREQIKEPSMSGGTPIIIRAANSIDILFKWNVIGPVLTAMAEDFKDNPVLLLFNREILWKPSGSTAWTNIGLVSNRGFNHRTRDLRHRGPAYRLKPEFRPKPRLPAPRIGPGVVAEKHDFPPETPEYLAPAILKLERFGLGRDEYGIVVDVPTQRLFLVRNQKIEKQYPVSTGKHGIGVATGSSKTPPGMHHIARVAGWKRRIGERVKDARKLHIYTGDAKPPTTAEVVTRALYIEGLERLVNVGGDIASRPIAIHGTNHENSIGQPASHGCIRMKNADVVELFDLVGERTLVEVFNRLA